MPDEHIRRDVPSPMMRTARCFALGVLFAALLPMAGPLPGASSGAARAQSADGLTVEQVQRRYRRMSEVHILKCDKDGNQLIDRKEMLCVRSIYSAMYLER